MVSPISYDSFENSVEEGAPVELYTFSYGGVDYTYTSAETDFIDTSVSPNLTYASQNISRNNLELTSEGAKNRLSMVAPRTFSIALLFRAAPPASVVSVSLAQVHRSDTEKRLLFSGNVLTVEFDNEEARLIASPTLEAFTRQIPRRVFSRNCTHDLYGDLCSVVKASHVTNSSVVSVSGNDITVGALASYTTYVGGYVEYTNNSGVVERRFIQAFSIASPVQTTLTLDYPFSDIAALDSCNVYPGCPHNRTACINDFNNLVNYGGQPFIPTKNPFNGEPVF